MKLTVFRYKVWNSQDDEALIPPFYAIREFIEQQNRASVIEDDYLKIDESDLDVYGKISTN